MIKIRYNKLARFAGRISPVTLVVWPLWHGTAAVVIWVEAMVTPDFVLSAK